MTGEVAPRREPRLAIVTCIKNEGEDLVEWLCFHRHIGVSQFVIYDNLSTDATLRILDQVPFRDSIRVHRVRAASAQKAAFADAIERYRDELDWVAFIDGDELIVPLSAVTILQRLADLDAKGYSGLGVYWRIFGSAGHEQRPAGLLTESFTRRGPDDFYVNRHIKSVAKIATLERMVTPHFFAGRGTFFLEGGAIPPANFDGQSAAFPPRRQFFAIHHYVIKSRAQWLVKLGRGRPKPASSKQKYRTPGYWDAHNQNDVEDLRAAEIIAPIRDEVLELRDRIGRD